MPATHPLSVAVDLPLRIGDAALTFAAGPAGTPRGAGVIVPLGRRVVPGIVLGSAAPRSDLRQVLAVVEPAPLVPPATVDVAEWTAREFLSSVGEALAVAVPWDAIWTRATITIADTPPDPGERLPGEQRHIDTIRRRPLTLTRATRLLSASPRVLAALASRGMLAAAIRSGQPAVAPVEIRLANDLGRSPDATADAERGELGRSVSGSRLGAAVREALASGARAMMVVGWSRTTAYLHAVCEALRAGWSCIATFATVDAATAFAAAARAAGLAPTLTHGAQAPEERLSVWRSLVGARGRLVVGTRASVFAPVDDPALIIVDDEDSSGHKEERAPRYLTRAVAEYRVRSAGLLVAGTATPTVASFAAVRSGAVRMVTLPSPRPRIGVIDLRGGREQDAPVSGPVLDVVRRTVRRGGRAILLADRKGYAGGLHCRECGGVERCARCGIASLYDRRGRRLHCRSCGAFSPAPHACSRCGAPRLHAIGAGTERVAAAVRKITTAVWRLDRDVVGTGGDVARLLKTFRGRGGILVATVLALPWLSWLRPEVVAVVAADRLLHRPEFRAAERALALLRLLSMATRTRVLVETSDPTHQVLQSVGVPLGPFYDGELAVRATLGYPPYRVLASVIIWAASREAADAVVADLQARAGNGVEVLVPPPSPAHRGRGRAGRRLVVREAVIKAPDRAAIRALLWPLLTGAERWPGRVRLAVDVEPTEV
jgi:primosomal protein N' (replication factor Y)